MYVCVRVVVVVLNKRISVILILKLVHSPTKKEMKRESDSAEKSNESGCGSVRFLFS